MDYEVDRGDDVVPKTGHRKVIPQPLLDTRISEIQ